jgi:hypothetical protein
MIKSENLRERKERRSENGELPLLWLDMKTNDTNLEVVKRSLETYCRKNFYHLRNCMELEELPILTPPDRNAIMTRAVRNEGMTTRSRANEGESPPHVPSAADLEYAKIILTEEYRVFKRNEMERERELSILFGVILGILELGLRQKVITNPDYAAIKANDNGFRLWKLVCRVVTTGGSVETAAMKEERILNRYQYIRMRNNESLADYHERFRAVVKNFGDNGLQGPSEARQAVRFINGLDNTLYFEFKRSLENGVHLGLTYPNTLAKALELTSNFKPMSRERYSSRTSNNAVYHITKNTNPRIPTGHRNHEIKQSTNSITNERHRKSNKVQSPRDQSSEEPKKEIICWKCNKKGHKMRECRLRDVKKSNYHAHQWEEDHEDIIDEFLRKWIILMVKK